MSKRFGRNQKRSLMQQLTEQQADTERFKAAYEMSVGLQRHTSEQLALANQTLELIYAEIAKNLNPFHPLLPNEMRRQIAVAGDVERIRIPLNGGRYKVIEILRRGFITDEFRDCAAVKISHGSKQLGYAVDMDALRVTTFKQEYINDLSRDIAVRLFAALEGKDGEK